MNETEKENTRLAAGEPKFYRTPDTEQAFRKGFHMKQVEFQCYNSRCLHNQGMGKCGHNEPTITLRFLEKKDGGRSLSFTCWTTIEKPVSN
jgi:hypothetical protein